MTTSGAAPSNLNVANAFTMLRVGLVPVFAWLLLWRDPPLPWLAAAVFAAAAATDSLDGFVARRLDQVTGLGQFLDPLADKLLVGTALVALAAARRMPWWAVWVILGREVAVSALRTSMARGGRALPASMLGKIKNVSQIVAVVLLAAMPPGHGFADFVLGCAVGLTLYSGWEYLRDARDGRVGVPWT